MTDSKKPGLRSHFQNLKSKSEIFTAIQQMEKTLLKTNWAKILSKQELQIHLM